MWILNIKLYIDVYSWVQLADWNSEAVSQFSILCQCPLTPGDSEVKRPQDDLRDVREFTVYPD